MAIRALGPATYELAFEGAEESRVFQMAVEGDEIKVVTWRDDFTLFVDFNTGPLGPVFKAVLDFHLARQVSLPPG